MKKILFLCTGNYYRSRFAEQLFNALAEKQGLEWRAFSRGLAVERGANNVGPISRYAVAALSERGIIVSDDERFPQSLTEEDLIRADRAIALDESEHRPLMAERFSAWEDAIEYWLVHDIGRTPPTDALKEIARRIEQSIAELGSIPQDI
ncbi:MAG: low molecular weight phosphatase family protein [Hormoscilla sp.]